MYNIREMREEDLTAVADVQARAFIRQSDCFEWIECNFRAFPRIQYFVIEREGRVLGFIEWMQKSGFRKEVVLELEQMAIDSEFQGQGLGRALIEESIPLVQKQLESRNANIKHIIVTTRADNYAQKLYSKTLNAKVEASFTDLYSADEVVMVARNFGKDSIAEKLN